MGFGGKLFAGERGFDPSGIVFQIISIQFIYYATLSFSILLLDFLSSHRPHTGQLFNPSAFDLSLDYAFITILANFLNILFAVLTLAYIVEKANRCLDFTLTIFILHVLINWGVYKFPNHLHWWVAHAVIITLTVLASEYACMKMETAEIKLSVNHILERGKQLGMKGASKIM